MRLVRLGLGLLLAVVVAVACSSRDNKRRVMEEAAGQGGQTAGVGPDEPPLAGAGGVPELVGGAPAVGGAGMSALAEGGGGETASAGGAAGSPALAPSVLSLAISRHTCAVLAGGGVKCWGLNDSGELGLEDVVRRGDQADEMGDNLPFLKLGPSPALTVGVGSDFSCALLEDGTIKCWGFETWGAMGYGDQAQRGDAAGEMGDDLPAVDLGGGRTAVALSASDYHTCAVLDDETVKCWGYNNEGELGLGDTANRGFAPGQMGDALPAVDLGAGNVPVSVVTGRYHSCALLDDQRVKCWGQNAFAELGLGDLEARGDAPGEMGDALPFVDLGTGRTALALAAGNSHTCALLDNATVKCWGFNGNGQLGFGPDTFIGDAPEETGDGLPIVDLGTDRTATAIAAGGEHTCAVLDDGSMRCWGFNGYGQLGIGDNIDRGNQANQMGDALPISSVGTNRKILSATAGGDNTCVTLETGGIKCWGYNQYGELGQGDSLYRGEDIQTMGDNLPEIELGAN